MKLEKGNFSADEIALVKGAPREVIQLCNTIQVNGEVRPLDDRTRQEILQANDIYARNALRVLALAFREFTTAVWLLLPRKR